MIRNSLEKQLKAYFVSRDEIVLAFVFGSRAKGRARKTSDWDIAVYFRPEKGIELETTKEYGAESEIRNDLAKILDADVDLLVLNRARPALVFSVLNSGSVLTIKDQRLFLELLIRTHYDAVDFWQFINEFWQIRTRAASLTPEAKAMLIEHITFLENEFADFPKMKKITWEEYMGNRDARRNLERWIENLVMASLDIAKIVLASDKRDAPQTYRDTLRVFTALYIDKRVADQFADCAELRNIIAHEYLDIRWDKIRKFMEHADKIYPLLIRKVKAEMV